MCFVFLLLDEIRPAGAKCWVSRLAGYLLPDHAEICIATSEERIEPAIDKYMSDSTAAYSPRRTLHLPGLPANCLGDSYPAVGMRGTARHTPLLWLR